MSAAGALQQHSKVIFSINNYTMKSKHFVSVGDIISSLSETCKNTFVRSDNMNSISATETIEHISPQEINSMKPQYVPPKEKILVFLDFYGVLNYNEVYYSNNTDTMYHFKSTTADTFDLIFSQDCIDNLNIILDKFDAHICITSTWRSVYQPMALSHILRSFGMNVNTRDVSIINNDPMKTDIGCSIREYFRNFYNHVDVNGEESFIEPTIPPFIIIDDGEFNLFVQYFDGVHIEHVKNGWLSRGFTEDHAYSVLEKLYNQIKSKSSIDSNYEFLGYKK